MRLKPEWTTWREVIESGFLFAVGSVNGLIGLATGNGMVVFVSAAFIALAAFRLWMDWYFDRRWQRLGSVPRRK